MRDKQTTHNMKNYQAFVNLVGGPEKCTGFKREGQSLNIKYRMDNISRIVNENKILYNKLTNIRPQIQNLDELNASNEKHKRY